MAVATAQKKSNSGTAASSTASTPEANPQIYADNFNTMRSWVNKQIKAGSELIITRGGRELKIVEMTKDGTFKVPNATADGFDYLPVARHLPAVLDGLIGS